MKNSQKIRNYQPKADRPVDEKLEIRNFLKILVLIDAWFPFVGGAQIHVKNLKKILENKYNIHYYILHSPSGNIVARFLWSLWVIPQALILNKNIKFNLIHAHAYWPAIPGKIVAQILQVPIIFTAHGCHLMDLKLNSFKAKIEKYILTNIKYDRFISVSSHFLKYQNINKNISIIPNGVDVKKYDKLKIAKEKPYKILFVGRDTWIKGLDYLKQAMKEVRKTIPNARLKIIKSGVSQEKLIREYKSSHLFVLPSLAEGQPLSLLEAWAAKLPVVVTAVGDNPRMVKNGDNGYLVKPKNWRALAKAIIDLLKSEKKEIMAEKGYLLVKKHYTWEECARKTYQQYKKADAIK